jgi:excinuclease UvrABC nuclease subunit
VRSLKARMDEAVLTERFERAASLRDLLARAKARG